MVKNLRCIKDLGTFLSLQDERYRLSILGRIGGKELLTSPSTTDSLLFERERKLSFLNLQSVLSSSKPEKSFMLRSRIYKLWSCENDLGMCPLNWFSFKSRNAKPEDDASNSCMEPHSWLFLWANLLSSGRANSCVGISLQKVKQQLPFSS